jgi:hypothetical protein
VVTSGSISPGQPPAFSILAPTLRAELGSAPRAAVGIDFVYRGPTESDQALASGELRRQIGLKLRARDTCNVVYVMWHIAPSTRLAVSVKSNPGQSRHAECGDRGYSNLEPASAVPIGSVRPGERHQLRAAIVGRELSVFADGVEAWRGDLPPSAFAFDGPVGLRSDNGEFDVTLSASSSEAP